MIARIPEFTHRGAEHAKCPVGSSCRNRQRSRPWSDRRRRAKEDADHLVVGRRLPESPEGSLVRHRREGAQRHHQGGQHLRRRRRAHAGRLRQADLGPHDPGCLQLRAAGEGRPPREVRCRHHEGTDRHPDDARPLGALRAADRLLGRHRLARQGVPRQGAGGLGSVLGHEELPRSTLRPQASRSMPSRWR